MEKPLKEYQGMASGQSGASAVVVRKPGGHSTRKLAHHNRHSPDGFAWGYSGSGPADLSRSLLFDAFGVETCPDTPNPCTCSSPWVDTNYQDFKAEILAKLNQDADWKLEQGKITDWVFDHMRSNKASDAAKVLV